MYIVLLGVPGCHWSVIIKSQNMLPADDRHVQLPEVDAELELQEAEPAGRAGGLQCRHPLPAGKYSHLDVSNTRLFKNSS